MSTAEKLAPELTPMIPGSASGFFMTALQEYAGNSGRRTAQKRDKDTWKTQIKDCCHVGVIFYKQSPQQLAGQYLETSRIYGKEKQDQKPCGGYAKGQYLFLFTNQTKTPPFGLDAANTGIEVMPAIMAGITTMLIA